jgi:carbamoyl-phosphate synthase/aspartate carbamoyltransferase/dihydroorotase
MASSKLNLRALTEDPASWKRASLLSVSQISPGGLELLFSTARSMRDLVRTAGGDERLKHKLLATVFYEASTRTSGSFQAAMMRLGGTTLHIDGQGNTSAGRKGETLEDTIRCLECYSDITVLRHPVQGSVSNVIEMATKPVINAGDGIGEHPSQALLDVFTIYDELQLSRQPRHSLNVVMLGDLKHGRTVHSLAKLLCTSPIWSQQLTLRYCAPDGLEMPSYVQHYCSQHPNVVQQESASLQEAIQDAHVLYVTRVQRERFDSNEEYEKVKVKAILLAQCVGYNVSHHLIYRDHTSLMPSL